MVNPWMLVRFAQLLIVRLCPEVHSNNWCKTSKFLLVEKKSSGAKYTQGDEAIQVVLGVRALEGCRAGDFPLRVLAAECCNSGMGEPIHHHNLGFVGRC